MKYNTIYAQKNPYQATLGEVLPVSSKCDLHMLTVEPYVTTLRLTHKLKAVILTVVYSGYDFDQNSQKIEQILID